MKIIAPTQAQIQRVLLTSALSFGLVLGAYSISHAQVRQATNDQQISYQTGGVGQEELDQLRQHEANYNTQLSFANASDRAYLNNLQVQVLDAEQQIIFEDDNVGPLLYLQLAPGTYEVKAISNGVEKQQKFTAKADATYSEVLTW
ncbi:MAG: hypothetical protein Q4G44_01990 [Alcaligenaceae bacterium]|nr:hypothetical protein [Alcaligenaceae bacterium]